jgi:hypothetical protein
MPLFRCAGFWFSFDTEFLRLMVDKMIAEEAYFIATVRLFLVSYLLIFYHPELLHEVHSGESI